MQMEWQDNGVEHRASWRSASGSPPPRRVLVADDRITADSAFRLTCEGSALLWQGDFQNARQLLAALARRIEKKPRRARQPKPDTAPAAAATVFHLYRQAQAQRAKILGSLLLPLDQDYIIGLRRAPDVRQACLEAYGPAQADSVVSMRELLGLIGAHEWRKKGVEIAALGDRIHPHYGVFAPIRGEYIELVAQAPLTDDRLAFDIGTGTGVLAAVLVKRGVAHVIATDQDPRALACARENIQRLGLAAQIEVQQVDLFPTGRAALIVCNPPWLPGRPSSPLEHAIYDPDSRMLRGFVAGLASHLDPGGEGWLILSDFAEHLGLRTRAELLSWFDSAGLIVLGRSDVKPNHPKVSDTEDPLHAARVAEVTSLWRLGVAPQTK
jgi:SAM-dependent methyltransferase